MPGRLAWTSAVALIAVGALIIGSNAAVRKAYLDCQGICAPSPSETTVTATGRYDSVGGAVGVTLYTPLERGWVYGTFSGACEGTIDGITRGDGRISGTISGVCKRLLINIPLTGTVDGATNLTDKTVMIAFVSKYAGFTLKDEVTLSYP